MRLVVETGSFTTEWAFIDKSQVIGTAETEVINPILQSRREISRLVRLNLPQAFFHQKYEKVFYYGVGCGTPERKRIVEASLVTQFKSPIIVHSVLYAVARGKLQDRRGVACVLGNHSGSGLYDGTEILDYILSGGYIMGDEGSASVLGRMFIADVLRDIPPSELKIAFYNHFKLSDAKIHAIIYEHPQPEPEQFFVAVSNFLKEHQEHSYVRELVLNNFRDFFARCVKRYKYEGLPICVVGHTACDFKPLLKKVAKEFNANLEDNITHTPMEGLVEYHLNHPEI